MNKKYILIYFFKHALIPMYVLSNLNLVPMVKINKLVLSLFFFYLNSP